MKVVLVTSPHLNHAAFQEGVVPLGSDRGKIAQTFAPMGLLSLAVSAADLADIEIQDINKAINAGRLPLSSNFYDAAASWLLEGNPDLVAFMSEADSYHHLLRICAALRSRRAKVRTLLGGPHATAVHRETVERFPAVDFVICGEGELAFPALIDGLRKGDLSAVGNLTYRRDEKVTVNETVPLIADLDDLPWPDYSLIDLEPDDEIFVEVGRGCPMACNFCFTAPYWQRLHRIKSPQRLLAEFTELKAKYGRTDLNLTHDLFTTVRPWVLDFCRRLRDSGLGITWTCSSRTDRLDEELIEAMAGAGCRNIYFGVESGTAAMQERIEKNLDLEESFTVVSRVSDAGIGVTIGFIAGLPGETESSLRGSLTEGFRYLALDDSIVHLFGYNPYRGSSVLDQIGDDLVFDPHFVDFPLGPEAHEQNCQLMRKQLDLFSRYTWLASYDDLDLATLRSAEEFFPIINAVRPLALAVVERGVEPLGLLAAWTEYIYQRNRERGRSGSGLYRGDIADFLDFMSGFVLDTDRSDTPLIEMIRWEQQKNVVRTALPAAAGGEPALEVEHELAVNPTAVVDEFSFAPSFAREAEESRAEYAFFLRLDGTPSIVRLRPFAALVLHLVRGGISSADVLVSALANDNGGAAADGDLVRRAIRELMERGLLLPAAAVGKVPPRQANAKVQHVIGG